LRQELCNISGAHLMDENVVFNTHFVRHIFPDRTMTVVTLAHREQGLMMLPGNPKGIHSLFDLTRQDVTFINRNPGSGTRLWLDRELKLKNIPIASIKGYQQTVSTHTESATLVSSGKFDAAIGLQASAQILGLNFVPLFYERYDLVFPEEQTSLLTPFIDIIQSTDFRLGLKNLAGYETAHSGEQIPLLGTRNDSEI
jgi:putative molybdopterin biosynthesis protein